MKRRLLRWGAAILHGMKTFFRLALIGFLLLVATACGNKGDLILPQRPGAEAGP